MINYSEERGLCATYPQILSLIKCFLLSIPMATSRSRANDKLKIMNQNCSLLCISDITVANIRVSCFPTVGTKLPRLSKTGFL